MQNDLLFALQCLTAVGTNKRPFLKALLGGTNPYISKRRVIALGIVTFHCKIRVVYQYNVTFVFVYIFAKLIIITTNKTTTSTKRTWTKGGGVSVFKYCYDLIPIATEKSFQTIIYKNMSLTDFLRGTIFVQLLASLYVNTRYLPPEKNYVSKSQDGNLNFCVNLDNWNNWNVEVVTVPYPSKLEVIRIVQSLTLCFILASQRNGNNKVKTTPWSPLGTLLPIKYPIRTTPLTNFRGGGGSRPLVLLWIRACCIISSLQNVGLSQFATLSLLETKVQSKSHRERRCHIDRPSDGTEQVARQWLVPHQRHPDFDWWH